MPARHVEFEVRELAAFEMLGAVSDFNEIADLWARIGQAMGPGMLRSADPAVGACAAEFPRGGRAVYAAGVPCEPGSMHPGLERLPVPGGRYAIATHRGEHAEMPQVAHALNGAVRDAGLRATTRWVELYYPDSADGRHHVEMGVLLEES